MPIKMRYRYLGFSTALFGIASLIGLIWGLAEREFPQSAIFLFVFAISFTIYGCGGTLLIDDDVIIKKNLFGKHRINWSGISEVECDKSGWAINFKSSNSQLRIPGPNFWKRENSHELSEFIQNKIEAMKLSPKITEWAFLRRSKNTKF